jgi:hypothetical protein
VSDWIVAVALVALVVYFVLLPFYYFSWVGDG